MRHRIALLIGFLALACLSVQTAAAARVTVRVEGKTQTIYGATNSRLDVTNALAALEAASLFGEFYYHVTTLSFGPYVDQIGRFPSGGTSGWVFKVNGTSPPVGADQVQLAAGDRVLWYWAAFGATGGPETLLLIRERRAGCYRVVAENDAGIDRPATGAVLVVDRRKVPTTAGRGCVGRHVGPVRATLAGAVRSNALA